jgi:hypothetical protein
VRLAWRNWHSRCDEPDPVTPLGINHEHLFVEVQKDFKPSVIRLCHATLLSH